MRIHIKRRSLRRFIQLSRIRLVLLLCLGVFLIGVGALTWFWSPRAKTYQLRISGGIASMNRHEVAEYLKRHCREAGVDLEILPTQGTVEAMRAIDAGQLDLALANGLLRFPELSSLRQVATITVEPVHLLVKRDLAPQVESDYRILGGLTWLGGRGGGETDKMTVAILRFLRLQEQVLGADSSQRFEFGMVQLTTELDRLQDTTDPGQRERILSQLPDVIVHNSILPSKLGGRLVEAAGYRLVPLRFARAFSLISVEEEDLDRDHVDQIHVQAAEIPAYTYGGVDPTPTEDCPTLGVPLILVAREDAPSEAITRILASIFDGALQRLYDPPELGQVAPIYPWHSASAAYRDKDKPLVGAEILATVKQVIGGFGPLAGGCLALFGYYRWRQLLQFLEYFREMQRLDLVAKGLMEDDDLPREPAERSRYLEHELANLQRKVVDRFCRNYFYGDGVLENFLALMSETRDYLRRTRDKPPPAEAPPGSEADRLADELEEEFGD